MPSLLDPIKIGANEAPNRIIMAPMTRARGTRGHVRTPIMATYYSQRASAGLIITEAIGVSREGLGWPFATGVWTAEQVAGWAMVTDAVHEAGGRIIAQLWHMGRVVHPSFLEDAQPVSASVTKAPGHAHTYAGTQPYTAARSLRADEIPRLLQDFRAGARNAIEAGFDGIQLHASNGYLIDQFLRDSANFRSDGYGGPIQNRIRLLREVTEAVAHEVGVERTGGTPFSERRDAGCAGQRSPSALLLRSRSSVVHRNCTSRTPGTTIGRHLRRRLSAPAGRPDTPAFQRNAHPQLRLRPRPRSSRNRCRRRRRHSFRSALHFKPGSRRAHRKRTPPFSG
ncbi:hypothetical protein ABIC10_007406 [Bradyrhizobium sp. S3.2.12]